MKAAVQPMPQPLRVTLWALYMCVALVVCVILTFPYDALRDRVLAEIGSRSGLHVGAAEWHLSWPPGFTGHRVTIGQPESWDVRVDRLALAVSVSSLLGGQPRLDVTAMLPGRVPAETGLVEAKMAMSSWSESGSMSLTGRMERVDLGTLKLKGVTQGLLQGTVEQQWQRSSDGHLMPIGEGNWDARVENVVLDRLPLGPLTLPTLTVAKATATVRCKQIECQILTFKGDGPDGSFAGTGKLTLGSSALQTNVELSLVLTPGAGYVQRLAAAGIPMVAGPITVRVSGSLAQPTVSL